MFTSKIFANTRILQGVKQKSKKFLKKFNKAVRKLNSNQVLKRRIIVASLVTKIVGVIVVGSVFSAESFYKPEPVFASTVTFDQAKVSPLTLEEKKPAQIVLGESNYQMEEREKREQELAQLVAKSGRATQKSIPAHYDPNLQEKRQLAKEAADKFGIDWRILESVWQVETGKSWDTSTKSYAGATGPMQFMNGTFRTYAVDGNGDGVTDINNARDAVYTAARHLATSGAAEGQVEKALFNYNHSTAYVNKVLRVANSITE